MRCGRGLEQQDVRQPVRHRSVLDAPRDHAQLARAQFDFPVPQLDPESPLNDEKHFVLCRMAVPHEVALELRQFHLLAVQLRYDKRMPSLLEARELVVQVDDFDAHDAVLPRRSQYATPADWRCVAAVLEGGEDPDAIIGLQERVARTGCRVYW